MAPCVLQQNVNAGLISLSGPDNPALSKKKTKKTPAAKAVKEIRFCSPAFIQVSAPLWPRGFSLPLLAPFPSSHLQATCKYVYATEMDLCALPAARAEWQQGWVPPLACTPPCNPHNILHALHHLHSLSPPPSPVLELSAAPGQSPALSLSLSLSLH